MMLLVFLDRYPKMSFLPSLDVYTIYWIGKIFILLFLCSFQGTSSLSFFRITSSLNRSFGQRTQVRFPSVTQSLLVLRKNYCAT